MLNSSFSDKHGKTSLSNEQGTLSSERIDSMSFLKISGHRLKIKEENSHHKVRQGSHNFY